MPKKVLYYLNQFFGQIGGEDKADVPPSFSGEAIGPAAAFGAMVEKNASVVGAIICGDNYFNENVDESVRYVLEKARELQPDLVVAGPAFNAGRYGMACSGVANAVAEELGIPVVTGMYIENPAVDLCKANAYIAQTGNSAADMRKALPAMAHIANKLLAGESLSPQEDGYIPQGKRQTVFAAQRGSKRAVDMLLRRLRGEGFTTEMPMPTFDRVAPGAAIKDLSKAKIALVTSGGIVPLGNPGRLESASAQKYLELDVGDLDELRGNYMTVHGGYDPSYANDFPDRVAPLDILKRLARQGVIGSVYEKFYTTTGTGTAVSKAIEFGKDIGRKLKEANVDGVIVTST